ncbi:MAG: hypothetical protein AABX47_04365 [Nanoarchaeota archaeon]
MPSYSSRIALTAALVCASYSSLDASICKGPQNKDTRPVEQALSLGAYYQDGSVRIRYHPDRSMSIFKDREETEDGNNLKDVIEGIIIEQFLSDPVEFLLGPLEFIKPEEPSLPKR